MLPILLITVLLIVLLLVLAYWLLRLGQQKQQTSGLPTGEIVYSDTTTWLPLERPLLSRRYGIVGKPDYIVENGTGRKKEMIPVEVKSRKAPRKPLDGHLLQLGAYCLLVEEQYGIPPTHGLLHYADATLRIPFTAELRAEVLVIAEAIRRAEGAHNLLRDHAVAARCRSCGYRHACGEEALP